MRARRMEEGMYQDWYYTCDDYDDGYKMMSANKILN